MTDNIYKIGRKILYKELQPLFEALSSIRYAVVKGEVLSQQIYGVPDRRKSSDIDILIDKKNVKFLEEKLHKLGFKQKLPEDSSEVRRNRVLCMAYSHQIPSYHKEKFGFHLNVDVNYDIFWGEYEGKRCSIEAFLSDTVDMEIYGVKMKTLPIEKAFLQLILHHYKEMNSLCILSRCNRIQTYMFRDVYDMLLNNCELLNFECVKNLCEMFFAGNYVYYIIYYSFFVFRDIFLREYLYALALYRNEELIVSYGLCSKERKKWIIPFEQRLGSENIFACMKSQLSQDDITKIELNNIIFT